MKAIRIIQLILFIIFIVYLVLLHNINNPIRVPLLIPMSPAIVIGVAFVLGWLIGLLPGQTNAWRKNRQMNKLQKRVAELEQHLPPSETKGKQPVIPDRSDELGV